MKNRILSYLILAIFTSILFYLLNEYSKAEQCINKLIKSQEGQYKSLFFYKEYFDINNFLFNNKIENIFSHKLCDNRNLLSDIHSSKCPYLVLRYSDLDCSDCYGDQLKLLSNYEDYHSNIMILYSHGNMNDSIQASIMRECKYLMCKIPINWNVNKLVDNSPYYFILYPNLAVSDIYIPKHEFDKETKEYLKHVFRKISYWKKE